MLMDGVVIGSIIVIALCTVFMVWFGVIAYRHIMQDKDWLNKALAALPKAVNALITPSFADRCFNPV